ncbi:RES domain-containing protein [Aquiflexum sp.]|uniref:RES domain-containing protein n=1 Tax=Aquiflexum sp. TaxID=1872584 RepID=UPI0035945F4F
MHSITQGIINDLEKFKKKFPFPFKSRDEKDNFLSSYQNTIEEIQSFCETEFDWFKSDVLEVKSTFEKIYDLTYRVIQSKLNDDDENAIHLFNILMARYPNPTNTKKSTVDEASKGSDLSFDSFSSLDPIDLFRIRRADWKDGKLRPFEKDDLFHIKYHDRRKCKNYRFSISGIPALYLGESIEICEHEVFNGGDLFKYYISQFTSRELLNVITIDFPDLIIWNLKHGGFNGTALRFFAYLPFSSACLFKTAPPHNRPFNPEYIIPQMLMSFIKKNTKLDGVRYPSTKFIYDGKTKPVLNYAFPVKDPDEKGFCKNLTNIFDWIAPVLSEIDYVKMKNDLSESAGKIEMSEDLKRLRGEFGSIIKSS